MTDGLSVLSKRHLFANSHRAPRGLGVAPLLPIPPPLPSPDSLPLPVPEMPVKFFPQLSALTQHTLVGRFNRLLLL